MSGHSKWATIKHKKGAADAKRGKMFTKMIREITTIAKAGEGNIETNPSLRTAIERANAINMPKTNVENAIRKGTGELPGVSYEEVSFEAYGPGGVAMIITGLTDNKNRTTAELRAILNRKNGSLANQGSVAFLFSRKGFISVPKNSMSEDQLMEIALDAGAEDIKTEAEFYEIYTEINDLMKVKDALAAKNVKIETAEMTMIPSTTMKVTGNDAKGVLALIEALEDQDDVQNVYANFDISDEDMEKISQEE